MNQGTDVYSRLDLSFLLCVLAWRRLSTKSARHSLKAVSDLTFIVCILILILFSELEEICTIAIQILEQKAFCQQDPDQDEEEEAPEAQAEYDSVLISSAGDLVASLANALGPDFAPAFNRFFPLIAKYYVSPPIRFLLLTSDFVMFRKRVVRSVTDHPLSAVSLRSSRA